MLCTICRANVALGRIAGPIRGQWCYRCLWDHATGGMHMPDLKKYKGPFQAVISIDGDPNEKVVGAGLDWQGAKELTDYYAGREHVQSVLIRDEPSQQTVEVVYCRDPHEQGDAVEQSEGDSTPVV
jgi:hypothetical protein